jgi:type VI secretion system secreted protein VgrG
LITGFPPGILYAPGVIHNHDALASDAQTDANTAYNILAGEPSDKSLTGQGLGGLTLTPGVYTFTSSAQLTGTLTLDAQGDLTAVWVFQIGSTLTTASSSSVVLENGGGSCHVFWQIGSSASLGTGTSFMGTIIAQTSITADTGANVTGRLLALTGAVTLDDNNVNITQYV